jgi:hypothetical protein
MPTLTRWTPFAAGVCKKLRRWLLFAAGMLLGTLEATLWLGEYELLAAALMLMEAAVGETY